MESRWLAALALIAAVIAGVIALPGVFRTYQALPLDPSAAHLVPKAGSDAAVIETVGDAGSHTPGVEGSVLFIRLSDAHGGTVVDTYFDWPQDEERIPPGHYAMVGYWRACDGNCGNLDAESPFCSQEVDVAPRDRVHVHVHPSDLLPGSSCTVDWDQ